MTILIILLIYSEWLPCASLASPAGMERDFREQDRSGIADRRIACKRFANRPSDRGFLARGVNSPVYNFVAWEVECVKIIAPEVALAFSARRQNVKDG